jgi:hypothetical protein
MRIGLSESISTLCVAKKLYHIPFFANPADFTLLFTLHQLLKGQSISEENFVVFKSPKKRRKYFEGFLP